MNVQERLDQRDLDRKTRIEEIHRIAPILQREDIHEVALVAERAEHDDVHHIVVDVHLRLGEATTTMVVTRAMAEIIQHIGDIVGGVEVEMKAGRRGGKLTYRCTDFDAMRLVFDRVGKYV